MSDERFTELWCIAFVQLLKFVGSCIHFCQLASHHSYLPSRHPREKKSTDMLHVWESTKYSIPTMYPHVSKSVNEAFSNLSPLIALSI